MPIATNLIEDIESALTSTPGGRLTLALLDLAASNQSLQSEKNEVLSQLEHSEADRAARLELIEAQGKTVTLQFTGGFWLLEDRELRSESCHGFLEHVVCIPTAVACSLAR